MTQAALNNLVSLAEHARRCGVSRAAVTQWKQQGRLTMAGDLVDHAASYKGEIWHASTKAALRSSHAAAAQERTAPARQRRQPQPVVVAPPAIARMTVAQVRKRLQDMDWAQQFTWDRASQEERARTAARCVGWTAATSTSKDDGHWGGFQLRYVDSSALDLDDIVSGFGYELQTWEVLQQCRDWLIAEFDDLGAPFRKPDEEVELIPALLTVLAKPLYEHDKVPE